MADIDSNSTDTTSIAADVASSIDYQQFTWNRMNEAHEALSILAGAKSLLQNSEDFEKNDDLVSMNCLLSMLGEKIDAIALALDGSTRVYSLKTTV